MNETKSPIEKKEGRHEQEQLYNDGVGWKSKVAGWLELPVRQLSALQIAAGCLAVLSQILLNCFDNINYNILKSTTHEGIWAGCLYVVTGCAGLLSRSLNTTCTLSVFLVLNVIGTLSSIIFTALVCLLLVDTEYHGRRDWSSRDATFVVLTSFLSAELVLALTQGIVTITCAAFCCQVLCCPSLAVQKSRFFKLPVQLIATLQIVVGIAVLALYAISYFLNVLPSFACEEIWCGLFFVVVGAFTHYAVRRVALSTITPHLVLNILSAIFATTLLVFAALQVSNLKSRVSLEEHSARIELDRLQSGEYNCTQIVLVSLGWKDPAMVAVNRSSNNFNTSSSTSLPLPYTITRDIAACQEKRIQDIRRLEDSNTTSWSLHFGLAHTQLLLAITACLLSLIAGGISCSSCCCCTGQAEPVPAKHAQVNKERAGGPDVPDHVSLLFTHQTG